MATSARPRLVPAELPGRVAAEAELERRFYARRRCYAAVIHLERLDLVERYFGAATASQCLETVAEQLGGWMRASDRLYRWSGAALLLLMDRDLPLPAASAGLRVCLNRLPLLRLGNSTLPLACGTTLFPVDESPSPALLARKIELHLGTAQP